ncbi:SprT-like domain-containing protein [Porticoccaceae bacterium]|jgi:SprT protein|nr:SprT-like domain-containing protein [Porticoccaceae bacterium]
MIEPISEFQRRQVKAATQRCIDQAAQLYGRRFDTVSVDFDLKGKCAGMYQVKGRSRRIRYNPWLFAKYFEDSLHETVPHEVAHYIVDCLYGLRRVKPHGIEWKRVMIDLGAEPKATGDYDLTGIPVRQYTQFAYKCGCRTHQLTSLRHKKILQRRAQYRCQYCHGFLVADIADSA